MNEAPETSELHSFISVVDTKSLTRAAAELQLPRATVSRRLARLEEKLGVRLLRRTTRSVALTDAGERFVAHARSALEAVSVAENSIRVEAGGMPKGPVRVSVPHGLGQPFRDFVTDFSKRWPDVQLQVLATSELVDLVKEGFDVALRASSIDTPGVVTRRVSRDTRIAVASPTYLKASGMPRTRADLRKHRCLVSFGPGRVPASSWPLLDGGQVHVTGTLVSNELALVRSAAVSGLGIAFLPLMLVREDLAEGALVHVLPKVVGADARLLVAWPDREFTPQAVRVFIDELVAWLMKFVQKLPESDCRAAVNA